MCFHRPEILYQIRIATKMMFAVCCMYASFPSANKQFVSSKQIKKTISAHSNIILLQKWLQHNKKLPSPTAGLMLPDSINPSQNLLFM